MRPGGSFVLVIFVLVLAVSCGKKGKNKGITYQPCMKLCNQNALVDCKSKCTTKKGYVVDDVCWKVCLEENLLGVKFALFPCLKNCSIKPAVCPPPGDPKYGDPPTKCCINAIWHSPKEGRKFLCQHVNGRSQLLKQCKKGELFSLWGCECIAQPECPDRSDPRYGSGDPPEQCCINGTFHKPTTRNKYLCTRVSDGKTIKKECPKGQKFVIRSFKNCSCEIPSPPPPPPVGCKWSKWNSWSGAPCSKLCGTGERAEQRTRGKQLGTRFPNSECQGDSVEDRRTTCNTFQCCEWSQWTNWTTRNDERCSKSCGGGTIAKYRTRTEIFGNIGASSVCQGDSEERKIESCNTACCMKCKWTEWSEWVYSSCMRSDDQANRGNITEPCSEFGIRTCNRTRTCSDCSCISKRDVETNLHTRIRRGSQDIVNRAECVGASIQHKSEQCCKVKGCPPEGDVRYGVDPSNPTACC
ncbi:unnamed protein product, partial [Owenia fusiformis]